MSPRSHRVAIPVLLSGLILVLPGCSSYRPILYPNAHLQEVGQAQADSDIADCMQLAGSGAPSGKTAQVGASGATGAAVGAAAGAVGGAVVGHPGRGAAIGAASGGTAGLLRGLLHASRPSKQYEKAVERCLSDRGYDPLGWE